MKKVTFFVCHLFHVVCLTLAKKQPSSKPWRGVPIRIVPPPEPILTLKSKLALAIAAGPVDTLIAAAAVRAMRVERLAGA